METPMHRHRHRLSLLALVTALVGAACTDAPNPFDVGSRGRSSAALRSYESCEALGDDLREHTRERARTLLLQQREQLRAGGGFWFGGVDGAPAAEADAARDGAPRQEGVDFSGTNNQEQGVDEADFVKTDGYFIYTLNGDRLEILGVPEFGQLTATSSTTIEGWPTQLLLSDDRAIVFSQIYAWEQDRASPLGALLFNDDGSVHGESLVKITVLDLGADRRAPRVERELYLEGHVLTGRRIDDVVRLASYAWFDVPGLQTWLDVDYSIFDAIIPESVRFAEIDRALERALAHNDDVLSGVAVEHFVPRLFERAGDRIVERNLRRDACRNVAIPEDGVAFGFTSLLTLGLDGDDVSVEADHVVSNYPILYSSTDTLLLAEPAQDWWWYWGNEAFDEATNIHRFRLDGATTTYSGSGRVDGTLLGQFALDAHDDVVRVAATVGRFNRWWEESPAPETSHLTTLGGETSLQVLGRVDGIAPNERLWSVRFTDDEAYLVTFQNIDPLWTVDLSDVTNPRILGELHVPGVSTYIHPLGDHLLTIGLAGTDQGLDWGVTQLSLFDITDRTTPTLSSSLRLSAGETRDGWQYGYSEATYEHKAFSYWGPQSAVAIPLSTWRWDENGGYEYKSELVLARAEAGADLEVLGTVDHAGFYNQDPNAWWDFRDIRRSYFMGDYIYAVSDKGVTCHRVADLTQTASVALQGSFTNR
jgi:hypothetical protein